MNDRPDVVVDEFESDDRRGHGAAAVDSSPIDKIRGKIPQAPRVVRCGKIGTEIIDPETGQKFWVPIPPEQTTLDSW